MALGLQLEPGTLVQYNGRRFVVVSVLNFDSVLARDTETGRSESIPVADVRPPDTDEPAVVPPDLSSILGDEWDDARRRYALIKPLLETARPRRAEVAKIAAEAQRHIATIYRWVRLFRTTGKLSSLLPTWSDGGRGKGRLDETVEALIDSTIHDFYLTRQQRSVQDTCNEVLRRCRNAKVKLPHSNTVRNRITSINEKTQLERRGHAKRAHDRFTARPGTYDDANWPLSIVQIDHTRLDVIAVDSLDRRPIGRPWLTMAIDLFSRMVVGFYVSFDPPGALGTGCCIAHAILPKDKWLVSHGIKHRWPCWGLPRMIHMDNAREFRGETVRRACEEYGIEMNFRPVKTPNFGGHIESALGTFMQASHALPGTTFSNPIQRGEQNPDHAAAMTIDEIEAWLAEYICGVYHQRKHSAIHTTPLHRYDEGIFGSDGRPGIGIPAILFDEQRVRLDFMPSVERTIQTYGIAIDNIHYYSDVLRPYIHATVLNNRKIKRQFVFKRDPRDISAVYFYDPELKQYSPIPYRNTSYPPISVWELREAQKRVEAEGRRNVDEAAIFEAYDRMRELERAASRQTKHVRLSRERRKNRPSHAVPTTQSLKSHAISDYEPVTPYTEIEEL